LHPIHRVAAFDRNRWPLSLGLGGRFPSESVAALARIPHCDPGHSPPWLSGVIMHLTWGVRIMTQQLKKCFCAGSYWPIVVAFSLLVLVSVTGIVVAGPSWAKRIIPGYETSSEP